MIASVLGTTDWTAERGVAFSPKMAGAVAFECARLAMVEVMKSIYNLLFTIFFWLGAPWYFLKMWRRGDWQRGFFQRFGRYDARLKQSLTNRHTIWFHAVSVGEVNLCMQLIRALEPRVPNLKIVVSTTTSTGMAQLQDKLPSHIEKIYYPIDRRRIVQRAILMIRPEAIILVEAEIWPNFLWRAFQQRTPVFLVNARLSRRSFRGYRFFKFLFGPIFSQFAGVGCQDQADADRLRKLGFRKDRIYVVGNLKFDAAARLDERRLIDVPALLRQAGVAEGAPLLVAGSTHPGEEAILAAVFKRLQPRFPGLFLIVVPRHFERSKEAARDIQSRGVSCLFRSELTANKQVEQGAVQCLVVNTTGELRQFYQQADVIFVGKSIAAKGGQNPIEPGALGKAMVFGPHMENFEAVARAFVEARGALQISDAAGLEASIAQLLENPALRQELGRNAVEVVKRNLGAVDLTVNMILDHLDPNEIYVESPR